MSPVTARFLLLQGLFAPPTLYARVTMAAEPNPAAPDTPANAPAACDAGAGLQIAATMMQRADGILAVYVGKDACRVEDPSGAEAITREFQALQDAYDHTVCARQSGDPATRQKGLAAHEAIRGLSRRLTLAAVHMRAEQALLDAESARTNATKARNTDDAKAAAKIASDQAKAARNLLTTAADRCTRQRVAAIEAVAALAQEQVDIRESAPNSMCGADAWGLPKRYCGVYGVSAAALSYLWSFSSDGVRAGRRLTSVGVPAVAFRWAWSNWISSDFGGYSAFITKSLASTSPSVDKVSCSKSPSDYENRLPCEASNEMYTYIGAYAGVTLGRKGVGFLTLAPISVGIAQLGTRSTLVPYFGVSVGVLQLNGSF